MRYTITEEPEMKSGTRATAFCAAIVLLAVSGCGGGSDGSADGNMAAVDEDSPEFAAMQYRQGLMHVLGYKVATLRDMAEGAIEADAGVFAKYAADTATAAGMLLEGFVGMEASSTGRPARQRGLSRRLERLGRLFAEGRRACGGGG